MLRLSRGFPVSFAGLLLLVPSSALARTSADGRIGPTSRSTIEIDVSVAPRFDVKRSGSPGAARAAGLPLCIASNNGAAFRVTAFDPSGQAALSELSGASLEPAADPACGPEQRRIVQSAGASPIAGTGGAVLLLVAPE